MFRLFFERSAEIKSRIVEHIMSRGDIKYLILYSIMKKPMHGYEIMNNIKEEFNGLYYPSPGTIYPTLQMLEEQGLIKVNHKDGKKIYEITKQGKEFMKENKSKVSVILKGIKESKILPIMKELSGELRSIGKELFTLATLTAKEESSKLRKRVSATNKILKEAMKKIREEWKN